MITAHCLNNVGGTCVYDAPLNVGRSSLDFFTAHTVKISKQQCLLDSIRTPLFLTQRAGPATLLPFTSAVWR